MMISMRKRSGGFKPEWYERSHIVSLYVRCWVVGRVYEGVCVDVCMCDGGSYESVNEQTER